MELITSKRLRGNLPRKVWQNDHPQDINMLIPRTYEYILSHGKRNFADKIKLDLELGRLSWITWVGPNVITRVLMRGR